MFPRLRTLRVAGFRSLKDVTVDLTPVTVLIGAKVGKHAHQVAEPQYDAHLPTFRDELRILAEHGAFPHAIVVIGAPFWSRSCNTLALGATFGPARIVSRTHFPGRLVHHANRLEVQSGERTSTVWHLRVKHPAGRSKKGSAAWLLGAGELAGAGVTSVAV